MPPEGTKLDRQSVKPTAAMNSGRKRTIWAPCSGWIAAFNVVLSLIGQLPRLLARSRGSPARTAAYVYPRCVTKRLASGLDPIFQIGL